MKHPFRIALCALLLASCSVLGGSPAAIKASALLPTVHRIVQRHNDYVRTDESMTPEARANLIAQGYSFEEAIAQRMPDGEVFVLIIEKDAREVCSRHDAYVRTRETDPLQISTYLTSSALVMDLINEANRTTTSRQSLESDFPITFATENFQGARDQHPID